MSSARCAASPRRRRLLAGGKWAVAAAAWALAILLLLPHATLVLVSLVPPDTWTTEAWPPVLSLANYAALLTQPERLRPVVNSLWMAVAATAAALVLGFAAACLAVRGAPGWARRARGPDRRCRGRCPAPSSPLRWPRPSASTRRGRAASCSSARSRSCRSPTSCASLPLTGRAALRGPAPARSRAEEAAASLGAVRARAGSAGSCFPTCARPSPPGRASPSSPRSATSSSRSSSTPTTPVPSRSRSSRRFACRSRRRCRVRRASDRALGGRVPGLGAAHETA